MFAQDLAIAMMAIGILSLLAFLAGRKVSANRNVIFVSTIFVAISFSIWFQGNLGWANLVPHSSAVLLCNFTPILVAFIAGFACKGLDLRRRSRPFAVTTLLLVAVACLLAPIIRPAMAPPNVSELGEFKGFVVLQSHESTCAPASAATLLRLHGIESSEKEMVSSCLTSEFGTEALGLYRGIKLGCRNQHRAPRVAGNDPYSWAASGQLPNVALVRFASDEYAQSIIPGAPQHERYQPYWFSGEETTEDGHAVVLLDYSDGKWKVADPAIGLVTWTDDEFRARFTGDAVYLAK